MPSAAQKQRRRRLKQKKEQKKGQNDDRIEPYVRRRIRRATESLSSNYGIAAPAPAATQAAPRPEPPDALVCPISMELMRDPVMAMDGHTYERRNIERWLADHQTSPKTNEPLPSLTLVPNHAVKSMVQDYLDG